MRKVFIILLIVGVLLSGTLPVLPVCDGSVLDVHAPNANSLQWGGGISTTNGGGQGGAGAPG